MLRLSRRAVPVELRSIRSSVEDWAQRFGIDDDTLVDLQLAIGEAVSNGIEHAYAPGEPGTVDVELELRGGQGVAVRVTDHGRWLPVAVDPGYRGRGLQMIERLARSVEVLPTRWGTKICFEIPLAV